MSDATGKGITQEEWAAQLADAMAEVSKGNGVTQAEWATLRAASRQAFPFGVESLDMLDVLLEYQQSVHSLLDISPVVGIEKSRRTGITWGVGSVAVLTSAAARSAGGMDTLYIGYNLDMAREFIDVCAMWAKAFNRAASTVEEFVFFGNSEGDKDIKAFRISFVSGYEIVALSSRPRSLRGRQGLVIIDEAAFHDDLPELLKAAMALLIWGGKVLVISTHDGEANAFNQFCRDIENGRQPGKLMRLDFDQALRQGLYQRICLVTGKEWSPEAEAAWREEIIAFYGENAAEELFVVPSKGGGAYLPRVLVESRAEVGIPVLRLEMDDAFTFRPKWERERVIEDWCNEHLKPCLDAMDPTFESVFGQDFARNVDLSCLWPAQITRQLVRRPPFVLEMRNIPFEQQRQILFFVVDRLPRFRAGALDATGNGGYLAEVAAQRYGPGRIAQVHLSQTWYAEFMPKLKAAFVDGTTTTPRDNDVVNDHSAVKLVRGIPMVPRESNSGDHKARRHGDSAIAHVLCWSASLMDVAPVEFLLGQDADHAELFRRSRGNEFNMNAGTGIDWSTFDA